ncbi:MAG: hypothetical protein GX100_06290 [candidate division WS1 bacterium]|nr:hypothetical protein [candidate division WS1 bacterium]
MTHPSRKRVVGPLVPLLCFALAEAALGQTLGPEAFGISARFGAAAQTTTRQMAMGVPFGCLDDVQFGNPAFAAVHEVPNAGVRWNTTHFERGPSVTSWRLHCVQPWHPDEDGFQLSLLGLTSSGGQGKTLLPPPIGGATAKLTDTAYIVDYGRRVTPELCAGLAIIGAHSVGFRLTPALGPPVVDVTANGRFGIRVGAAYEWLPGDYAGLTYAFAQHSVWTSRLTMAGVVRDHDVLNDSILTLGISRHLTPELLALVEYHHGTMSGGGVDGDTKAWHLGAEYMLTPQWALRVGDSDGATTLGLGWGGEKCRLDYAYLRDWNGGSIGALLGDSDTHSLEVTVNW